MDPKRFGALLALLACARIPAFAAVLPTVQALAVGWAVPGADGLSGRFVTGDSRHDSNQDVTRTACPSPSVGMTGFDQAAIPCFTPRYLESHVLPFCRFTAELQYHHHLLGLAGTGEQAAPISTLSPTTATAPNAILDGDGLGTPLYTDTLDPMYLPASDFSTLDSGTSSDFLSALHAPNPSGRSRLGAGTCLIPLPACSEPAMRL